MKPPGGRLAGRLGGASVALAEGSSESGRNELRYWPGHGSGSTRFLPYMCVWTFNRLVGWMLGSLGWLVSRLLVLGSPSLGLGSPSKGLGSPSLGLGTPSLGLGFPNLGLGECVGVVVRVGGWGLGW